MVAKGPLQSVQVFGRKVSKYDEVVPRVVFRLPVSFSIEKLTANNTWDAKRGVFIVVQHTLSHYMHRCRL